MVAGYDCHHQEGSYHEGQTHKAAGQSGWCRSVVHQPLDHVIVNLGEECADNVLDFVESFGAEEQRLVVRDVVGLNAHSADVKPPKVGLGDLLDLTVGRKQAGALRADFALLAYHAELQGEPKDLRDKLQRLSCLNPPGSLPGYAVEGRKAIMGQAVTVADDFMDDVGLWCVERYGVVPNVLRGVENPVRQGSVKLKERDKPGRRHVLEARKRAEHLVHLNELRNMVLGKLKSLLPL